MSKFDLIKKYYKIEKDEDMFSPTYKFEEPKDSEYPETYEVIKSIEDFDKYNNINKVIENIEDIDVKNAIESVINDLDYIKDDAKKVISKCDEKIEEVDTWARNWKEIALELFSYILENGDISDLEKNIYLNYDLNSTDLKNFFKSVNTINKFNI